MFKKFIFLIVMILSFLIYNQSFAENLKISYVNVEKIISDSNVGKKVNKDIESKIKKKAEEFRKIEAKLKKEDENIIKQKNILSKDELNKKIDSLQKEVMQYRAKKDKFNKLISENRLKATSNILSNLNKILGKYASDNSISLIIQKKNIVIGKSELDITDEILNIFNKEVKDVKLN